MTEINNATHESIFGDMFDFKKEQSSETSETDQPTLNERAVKALEIIAFAQIFPLQHRLPVAWQAVFCDWLRRIADVESTPTSPVEGEN